MSSIRNQEAEVEGKGPHHRSSRYRLVAIIALSLLAMFVVRAVVDNPSAYLPQWMTHTRYQPAILPFSVKLPRGWQQESAERSVTLSESMDDLLRLPSLTIQVRERDEFLQTYAANSLQEAAWRIAGKVDEMASGDVALMRRQLVAGEPKTIDDFKIYQRVIEYPLPWEIAELDVQLSVESSGFSPGTLGIPVAVAYFEYEEQVISLRRYCPNETVSYCKHVLIDTIESLEFYE